MNKRELSKKTSQVSCAYDKNGYIGVLTVAGVLTPDCAEEISARLRDSMTDADFVVVNLDQATIDSDCFSLFCLASRTAYSVNKRLHLGRATPEQQLAASQMCSSNLSKAARHDCATHCFWLDRSPGS